MRKTSEPSIYLLISISMLIMVSLACNFSTNDVGNLSLEPRAEDGSVSGRYRYPDDLGDHNVRFTVTSDGFATFHLEDAPESETLTVDLSDDQTARLEWNGTTLDGLGALTGEAQAALDNLMDSDLAHSLGMIPLDVGCQGDEEIDAQQVAALLVPLQMRFKYLVTDRESEASRLIALSECGYGSRDENKEEQASFIMFSPAMPVPVVFGYFPFDAEGAVEAPRSSDEGLHTACLNASSSVMAAGLKTSNPLVKSPESILGIRINEYGPCDAMCRGACGADCPLSNCTLSKELRCEKDEEGGNTGMEIRYLSYDCGLHQGCIDHDNCYDQCNEEYGCGTWLAAYCRHLWVADPIILFNHPNWYCDQKAIAEHGVIDPPLWSRGYGPQPMRETFEYMDVEYGQQQNLDNCPLEEPVSPTLDDEDGDATTTTEDKDGTIPVGTYVGVTNIPSQFFDETDFVVEKNEIILIVEEDGTTHGEKTLIYSYTRIGIDDAIVNLCGEWTGPIEGKLTDFDGELTWILTYHFVSSGPGIDNPQDRTDSREIPYVIHVSGEILSASLKGEQAEPDKDIFSFELTKQ